MRFLTFISLLSLLVGCDNNDLSYLSICNETPLPIYAISYTSDYSDGDWIPPGVYDEFYSIGIDHLNGYEYFSAYYDSLVVFLKDYDDYPIKFYSDGRTINYDPELNPFTNPDVWQTHAFNRRVPGSSFESLEEKQITENYFSIEKSKIISLPDSILIN